MSWLTNEKNQAKNKKLAEKEARQNLERLYRQLTPMVLRLLNDYGDAMYGRKLIFFKNYSTDYCYGLSWAVQGYPEFHNPRMTIELKDGYFDVHGRETKDTSEAELKKILAQVFKNCLGLR